MNAKKLETFVSQGFWAFPSGIYNTPWGRCPSSWGTWVSLFLGKFLSLFLLLMQVVFWGISFVPYEIFFAPWELHYTPLGTYIVL
jgi:hypothetical protein